MQFTVWAEDAYCVCKGSVDGETYLETTHVQLYFQGGNVLVGDDFWFFGADYPSESIDLGFVAPQPEETMSQAVARTYGSFTDHKRELVVIGSPVPVPATRKHPVLINDELWHEVLYFGNKPGSVQPLFHIDMFMSLVGRNSGGTYTILVGSPQLAADILGEPLREGAMQDVFDDIAAGLSDFGLNVVRIFRSILLALQSGWTHQKPPSLVTVSTAYRHPDK